MPERQEEQKIERLVRHMFEAELCYMEDWLKMHKPVEFSDVFEQGMQRLVKSQRRNYQIRTAARYVLTAAAVLLILLCLTNPGYIAKAWDVLVKWHSTHLEVDVPNAEWTGAVPRYELTYVPEGFELVMEDCDEIFGGIFVYKNGEQQIQFHYSTGGGSHNYDNERSEILTIQDTEGNDVLWVKYGDGGHSMLWRSKEGLMFSLNADVAEEELFRIKDGIKVKK